MISWPGHLYVKDLLLFPSKVVTVWLSAGFIHWLRSKRISLQQDNLQQIYIFPVKSHLFSRALFTLHVGFVVLVSSSARSCVVLPRDYNFTLILSLICLSLQMDGPFRKLQCRPDLPWEFAIYFCSSSQCLWLVSTGCSFVIPCEASTLQGSLSSGFPYFLLSFGFCNLFLQVMSDVDPLVVGFSFGHSPVNLFKHASLHCIYQNA